MGDKGGKKDKDKDQKQKITKKEQEDKKKQDKQPKKSPWEESGFQHAEEQISDEGRSLFTELRE